MSYSYPAEPVGLEQDTRRIARAQIEKAIAEIDDGGLDRGETVHQLRKRCKKLRGLVRLVRPRFPKYAKENAAFRDLAAELSATRDAQTLCDALKVVEDRFPAAFSDGRFAPVRAELERRRDQTVAEAAGSDRLGEARQRLLAAETRVRNWSLQKTGFDAIGPGLKKTYQRCRAALKTAEKKPSNERLHELRKRSKYHWYHLRLLKHLTPDRFAHREAAASALGDLLGDDHDLAVLRATLKADREAFGGKAVVKALSKLIDEHRLALQGEAFGVAHSLFDDKPAVLVGGFGDAWRTAAVSGRAWSEPGPLTAPALVGS